MARKNTKKTTTMKAAEPTKKKAARAATTAPARATAKARDPRLPAPGGVIEKVYKNQKIVVQVTDGGLVHDGVTYPSPTALALKITGYRAVSGPRFFGLVKPAPNTTAKSEGR